MAYHQQGPGSPFVGNGDTTYTKVFVGGLAWETQSGTLRRYFEHFGDILEAVVITDKNTGRSKGYGFVTFRDPESARRACENPSPVIDGRRANCNLAALGRLRPPLFYGRIRPFIPAVGGVQTPRGHLGSPNYQQPNSYGYQPGYVYSPYGYTAYSPEFVYPQGVYNPYLAQHYYQIYGVPSAASSGYSYGQLGHPPSGGHGYVPVPGYGIPGQHIMQYGAPNVNGATTTAISPIQAPYPSGIAAPAPSQAQIIVSAHSPQFTSSSDQTVG